MGIGGSIFLIVVGAIIAFGVENQSLGPFDLNVIGWILIMAGLAALALTLWVWNSRRSRAVAPPRRDGRPSWSHGPGDGRWR